MTQWDGKSGEPIVKKTVPYSANTSALLTLTSSDQKILVSVDGTRYVSLNTKDAFSTGDIWFGADGSGDGWTLNDIQLGGGVQLQDPSASEATRGKDTLASHADAYRPMFKIGSAISLYPLMIDPEYRKLALNHFSIWTPENEMKAQFIHSERDVYTFEEADALVETAQKNGIAVHGHALVFGEANPKWMQNTPKNELQAVMGGHITSIMRHFKGKVSEWDVINEPLSEEDTPDNLRRSIWYNAMGKSFIANALRIARAADPDAKLYINEYGLEEDGERWNAFLNLIKELKADNVPLDGVGFQSHIYEKGDEVNTEVLRSHIRQLAELGIVSRISEADVHGENSERQAQQYAAVLKACIEEPTCTSFSVWGISDKYGSTTSDHTYLPEYGDDLLWNSDFKPKEAYKQIVALLVKP